MAATLAGEGAEGFWDVGVDLELLRKKSLQIFGIFSWQRTGRWGAPFKSQVSIIDRPLCVSVFASSISSLT